MSGSLDKICTTFTYGHLHYVKPFSFCARAHEKKERKKQTNINNNNKWREITQTLYAIPINCVYRRAVFTRGIVTGVSAISNSQTNLGLPLALIYTSDICVYTLSRLTPCESHQPILSNEIDFLSPRNRKTTDVPHLVDSDTRTSELRFVTRSGNRCEVPGARNPALYHDFLYNFTTGSQSLEVWEIQLQSAEGLICFFLGVFRNTVKSVQSTVRGVSGRNAVLKCKT